MNKYYVYTVNSDEPFIVRTTSDLQENYTSAIVETNGVGTWRFEYEGEENQVEHQPSMTVCLE